MTSYTTRPRPGMMPASGARRRGARLAAVLLLCLGGLVAPVALHRAAAAAPTLILGRAQNGPNNTEPVSGSGFTPNSQVDILIRNSVLQTDQVLATLPTDAGGSFAGTVTLPLALDAGPAAPNTLTARDGTTPSLQASQPLIGVAVGAVLTMVSPAVLTPGGTIAVIQGTGFGAGGPSERNKPDVITLYLGDIPIATATTGPSGNFSIGNVRVPLNVPVGDVEVIARGIVTGIGQFDEAYKAVSVVGTTNLTAAPNPTQPGGTVTTGGSGFGPNETVNVTAIYADPAMAGTIVTRTAVATTSATGAFGPVAIVVPSTAPRTSQLIVLARGVTSDRAAGAIVSLLGAQALFFDPTSAPPGTTIVASGFGFIPGQQISILGAGIAKTALADPLGVFTTTFTIPTTTRPGTYALTIQDQSGDVTHAPLTVSAPPTATVGLSPTVGAPGSTAVITGAGFTPGEPIAFSLETSALATLPAAVVADAGGAFTATIVLPSVPASRSYALTARGRQSLAAGVATLRISLPVASRWYFAEGFTGQGPTTFFSETLHLLNPTTAPATGNILYMLPGGITQTVPVTVPAQSVVERSVNRDVGPGKAVSALVTMDQPIVANRVIVRTDAAGARLDGNSSSGEAQPARLWHFAEGYTGVTFQQYLTVQNPSAASTAVTITLLPPAGTRPVTVTATLPALSRYTLNVRAALPNRSLSTLVRASVPVVAERVLYWGTGSGSGKFGSDVKPGVPAASLTSYFATASVANGDQPFTTVLNPAGLTAGQPATVTATATYVDASGKTLGSTRTSIGPGQRGTLVATGLISSTGPVATLLSASSPVAAEQAQYAGGSPNVGSHAGFALLGRAPATLWQFALGDTRGSSALPGGALAATSTVPLTGTGVTPTPPLQSSSFTEKIYLYNPGSRFTNVVGVFYTPEGLPYYTIFDLRPHTLLAIDPSTIKGLPAGVHGSVFNSPQEVRFVAAQVLRSLDGRVLLGDEGTAR